jgi:hypothetical protein
VACIAKIPRAISDFHRSESLKSVDISENFENGAIFLGFLVRRFLAVGRKFYFRGLGTRQFSWFLAGDFSGFRRARL